MPKKGTGTVYRMVVRGELSDRYAVAFERMQMETKDGRTILSGEVADQPHL
jgi:osmotically-inducible protein OsmY